MDHANRFWVIFSVMNTVGPRASRGYLAPRQMNYYILYKSLFAAHSDIIAEILFLSEGSAAARTGSCVMCTL
jgi:hypothetical protein